MAERVNDAQKIYLVDYMSDNHDVSRGTAVGPDSHKKIKMKWKKLVEDLNSMGPPIKTETKWRKVWTDMRHAAKKKASAINRSRQGTGGGPEKEIPLSDTDEKIISLIPGSMISGIEAGVSEVTEGVSPMESAEVVYLAVTDEEEFSGESSESSHTPISNRRKRTRKRKAGEVGDELVALQKENNTLIRETRSVLEDIAASLRTIAENMVGVRTIAEAILKQ